MDVVPRSLTRPSHPERVCWGCNQYCPAHNLTCGKDTVRTPHPIELFGDDWNGGGEDEAAPVNETTNAGVREGRWALLRHTETDSAGDNTQ